MRFVIALLLMSSVTEGQSLPSLLAEHRARPADWKICNQIAIAYTEQQDFENAATFYRKVTRLNPAFVPARKNLAVVLWFGGKKTEAVPLFRQLLGAIPNDPVPHLYLALAYNERGEHAQAWKHFVGAGDLAFNNPEVLPAVLDSALAIKDKRANDIMERMRTGADQDLALRAAAVLDNRHLPEQAYALYTHAIEVNPDKEQVYTALAAFSAEHQNTRFAVDVLDQGLQRLPRSAPLLVSRGLLVAIEGDRDQAESDFKTASQISAGWEMPLLADGVLQLESGRLADAVKTFRSVCDRFPKIAIAHYLYAVALSRIGDASKLEGVIAALNQSIALAPDDSRARALLGQTYVAVNRLRDGVAQLERAVKLDPRNPTAEYQLALAYRKLGNSTLAEQHMRRFRELKQTSPAEQGELVHVLKILK